MHAYTMCMHAIICYSRYPESLGVDAGHPEILSVKVMTIHRTGAQCIN